MFTGKALTVDDSPAMRTVMKTLLQTIGFAVSEAESVKAAMSRLEVEDFDVIVTDMNMPGQSGLALIRQVRTHPRHAAVPLLVVSSESNPALRTASLNAGAAAWVAKPVDARCLLQTVAALTSQAGAGDLRPDGARRIDLRTPRTAPARASGMVS